MTTEPSLTLDRDGFVEIATEAGERDDADRGGRPAVVRVAAPLDTAVDPLAAYATLGDGDYAFLLESAEKVASSDPAGAFSPVTDGGTRRDPGGNGVGGPGGARDTAATGGSPADGHARYSFVGYDPAAVVTIDPGSDDPGSDGAAVEVLDDRYEGLLSTADELAAEADCLDALRAALPDADLRGFPERDRQLLNGGLVGFLAYDAVYDLFLDEVGIDRPESRFPDAQFVLADRTLVFDHVADTVELVFTPVVRPDEDAGALYDRLAAEADRVADRLRDASVDPGGFHPVHAGAGPRDAYEDAVRRAKEHVLDGDIYQGVISRKRELYGDVDPLGLYAALREVNPSPYMYLLGYDDLSVVGASPETLISVTGRRIVSNPIAGTIARGDSPVEDRRLAGELLADEKERAEHTMLVDLARNDVRRVAEQGTVRVEEFMNVLKYSHVQHIESTVTGTLAADADAFDATRAAFPAGTLSGAPKMRAMEVIDALEREPRGLYGGGVGYYSWNGDTDFAIVIRTATVERGVPAPGARPDGARPDGADDGRRTDRTTVQAGAGIVADSDPAREFDETEEKMRGVLVAIEAIERESPATARDREVVR